MKFKELKERAELELASCQTGPSMGEPKKLSDCKYLNIYRIHCADHFEEILRLLEQEHFWIGSLGIIHDPAKCNVCQALAKAKEIPV